jgi:predicted CopG family antitoxin
MTSKTITIKEDIYKMLLGVKRKNESFSNLFERLVKSRSSHEILTELRGGFDFENKDVLLKELYEKRRERRY